MLDLDQLQIIGQLVDNIEVITGKLEDSFKKSNGEEFNKSKNELLRFQRETSKIINQE